LIEEVMPEITGCENGCTLDQFEQRSQPFKPNGDGNTAAVGFVHVTNFLSSQLCNTNLFNDTSSPTPPTKDTPSQTSPTKAASSQTSPNKATSSQTPPTKETSSQTSPTKATSSLSSNQLLVSIGLLVYIFKHL
jgi:hypothetical protein